MVRWRRKKEDEVLPESPAPYSPSMPPILQRSLALLWDGDGEDFKLDVEFLEDLYAHWSSADRTAAHFPAFKNKSCPQPGEGSSGAT